MGNKKKEAKEKPLDKMTATELRDLAKQVPDIIGVHGMNKPELISALKKARGIADDNVQKVDSSVRELKSKLRAARTKMADALNAGNEKLAAILKKRTNRLKKLTRRTA